MKVALIKDNEIITVTLPKRYNGSYWVIDYDSNGNQNNLIGIEGFDNCWKMISNDDVGVVTNNTFIENIILKEEEFYLLKERNNNNTYLLYTYPSYDNSFNCYSINDKLTSGITIGTSPSSNIVYPNSSLEGDHAKIINQNNEIYIIDNNSKNGVFVNNKRVNEHLLESGDIIFIMGLRIIFLKLENSYCLMINNPKNVVNVQGLSLYNINRMDEDFIEDNDDIEMKFYSDSDYFYRNPRFISLVDTMEIKIDAPPNKEEEKEMSLLLTMGPMITMSMTSMISGYVAINNVYNNGATWASAAPSLVMCGAMLGSTLVWPSLTRRYEKKRRKKDEAKRQEKYSGYIDGKREDIMQELKKQHSIMLNSYPSLIECQNIILNKQTNLWERKLEDPDFLTVSLGYGTIPMRIDIKYPEEHFSMEEDNLKEIVNRVGSDPKNLQGVPVTFSFSENATSALVGNHDNIKEYLKQLILQIVTFHSYDDLKIAMFTNEKNKDDYSYLKMLPHSFSNDKEIRFFGTNNDEDKEIIYQLERIYNNRKEQFQNKDAKLEDIDTAYLLITDSYKTLRNFDFIQNIIESKQKYGFFVLILNDKLSSLPDKCEAFINVLGNKGEMFKSVANNTKQDFEIDFLTKIDMNKISRKLANIPIEINDDSSLKIPSKLGFLEMYEVGKIEQLNSLARWEKNNPMMSLQVPVGFGKSGEKIGIDLHEKYHGPHGLIAGMTGSGKSEFIITYILSLAINFHPYEVQFILIDYKGGGLAGAFENNTTGVKLPHLVGTITNLDTNSMNRSLASIESELKRRQRLFNMAREKTNESTIDIYKYQKLYREGVVEEPLSHLFIISDEFAELKQQQPEFMQQLISTARIGRSLGVHLILATQKPSGVVDAQIWSNTRFRVCLRVQEKSDSSEVIKCPDAAFLKETGRFYFQVGYNEIFVLGQAAWAGGKYLPTEKAKKNIDTSIEFINNIGYVEKKKETKPPAEIINSNGEELLNIVKYLADIAKKENISTRPLWLDSMPEYINLEELIKKYPTAKEKFVIDLAIGEYDIPNMQEQRLLSLNLTKEGNTICYGSAGSGKENFITTLIYSAMLKYTAEEINFYILDFGSESLKMFKSSPLVGDIINIDDEEKIDNLYKMLTSTIDSRKDLFANYNGDFLNYCKKSSSSVPNIVVIINNFEAYQETFSQYDDILGILTRDSNKYGIYFLIAATTPNGIRLKLKQNFQQLFALQQNNIDDYSTILGSTKKKYPSKMFGRGIFKTNDIYEFQTAMVTEKDEITNFIVNKCREYKDNTTMFAKPVPILPDIVTYDDVKEEIGKTNELVIGIAKKELEVIKFDFMKNYITLISALDISSLSKITDFLIKQILYTNQNNLIVMNALNNDFKLNNVNGYQYIENNFSQIIENMSKVVDEEYSKLENNEFNADIFSNVKKTVCIIIGINEVKNKLSDDLGKSFEEMLKKASKLTTYSFIIVDNVSEFKKVEFDSWFKENVTPSEGIWIGEGIGEQFLLKINQRTDEVKTKINDDFCFVLKRGKPRLVKYVSKFDVEINDAMIDQL